MKAVRIFEYAKLMRVEYLGFSCVCVMGALSAVGKELQIRDGIVLFLIHMFSIIWGFVHNDYCDVGYDSSSAELKERPLVKGSITRNGALVVIVLCMMMAFLLATVFYGRFMPLAVYLFSVPLAIIYNKASKQLPGADIFFAGSAALLCLFGALAVIGPTQAHLKIPTLVWVIVAIQFVDHLFFNIAGGLKDLEIDYGSGARTTPIALGVRVVPGNKRMVIPIQFKVLAIALKLVTIGLVYTPFLFLGYKFHPLQMAILSAMAALALFRTLQLVNTTEFSRKEMAFMIIKQENACKALVPLMLVSHIGLYWFLFFLIPTVWFLFFNALVNGQAFQPPKTY